LSTGIGDALLTAREEQGRDLQDVARVLRVRTDYLRALEDEEFDTFGGDIYAKGFLRSYAVELGLDPEPLLDLYRREVSEDDMAATTLISSGAATKPTPRSAPPAWMAWVVVAVAVLVGLALLGFLGDRTPEQASPGGADEDPPTAADNGDEEGEAETEPEPEEEPEPDPEPEEEEVEGVELMLAFEENSWLRVVIDGTPVIEETVPSGETRQFEGDSEIEIRFGNAGGVRVEYNGEDIGTPGTRGQPVTVTFTQDGVEGADA
jgi:cytoskeleton protein RodZ